MPPAKSWLKWTAIGLGSVVGLVVVLVLSLQAASLVKQSKRYAIPQEQLALTALPDLARGEHLVKLECVGCHGDNLDGHVFFSTFAMGTLYSRNLTKGTGGIGRTFSTADFVRAIRYGVGPDGHTVLFMPTNAFEHFSDADLASIIAYVQQVSPVDHDVPLPHIGPMARILTVLTPFPLFSAEQVEKNPNRVMPSPSDTVAFGSYLAHIAGCLECHGPTLGGGGGGGTNITPGGPLGKWTEADFMRAIKEGKRPDGTAIPETMPWKDMSRMSDQELDAVWQYVHSVPPVTPPPKKS